MPPMSYMPSSNSDDATSAPPRLSQSRRPQRLLVALVAVLALIAAACGDDGDATTDTGALSDDTTTSDTDADNSDAGDDADVEDASTSDGDDETITSDEGGNDEPPAIDPADLTASWTGVTESTIRLGFTTSDLDELRSIGLVDINRGDPQQVLDALIDDVNSRGGINGRMLEATLEVLVPFDSSAADAACVAMTEDIEVFAVLAPFTGPNSELNSCISERNETVVVGGTPTPSQLEGAQAPWLTDTMFSDRRLAGVVQLMEDEGLLGDTVGVVFTPEERSAADDIVIPELNSLGKDIVDVVFDVPDGDTFAGASEFETFVEIFRTEGVDSVVLVENTATFGSSQLAGSDLDANILIVDTRLLLNGLGALADANLDELAGVIGSGGASNEERWELEATQDCVRAFEDANPDIEVLPSGDVPAGDPDWLSNILIFCTPLRLFELAATAAGAELTHETFLAGADSLGEIDLPGTPFASIGPGKYDAADAVRLTVFDPTVSDVGGAGSYGPLVALE